MEAHFEIINTLSLKSQLRILCSQYPVQVALDEIHSYAKELKMINRIKINNLVKGIKISERPDEILLKAD